MSVRTQNLKMFKNVKMQKNQQANTVSIIRFYSAETNAQHILQ